MNHCSVNSKSTKIPPRRVGGFVGGRHKFNGSWGIGLMKDTGKTKKKKGTRENVT